STNNPLAVSPLRSTRRALRPRGVLRLCSFGCGGASAVHQVFEFFTGLEIRDALGRHVHSRAGFRIAPHARLSLARAEAAEPADLDFIAGAQSPHHTVENRLH